MAGAQFYFEKVRDRQVWDFALVNVASAMVVSGDKIDQGDPVMVNASRRRRTGSRNVETAIIGKARSEDQRTWRQDSGAVEGAQDARLGRNGTRCR